MKSYTLGTFVNCTFDNLGGNQIYGLTKSLSATFFCRMCICTREETRQLTIDLPDKYRDRSNYEEALRIIEESSKINVKETKGIGEYCVLNEFANFQIFENWTANVMHDLCEGKIRTLLTCFFQFRNFEENNFRIRTETFH